MKPNLQTSAYDRYLAFRATLPLEKLRAPEILPTVSTYHERKG